MAEGYAVTAVPTMRMVIDLAGLDRSRWIQLSGSSGHAYHDHYSDQLPLWAEGKTLPWVFDDDAIAKSTDDTSRCARPPNDSRVIIRRTHALSRRTRV